MNNMTLAQSYLRKASDRLDILSLLLNKGAYSHVIREAQEIVELALKGMLRSAGIQTPKFHDVGGILLEHRDKYPEDVASQIERSAEISKRLRKERGLSFCGDIDFIPTEEYRLEDA
ncbi:MAG: HEPN domain-containing protein [Syntrophaceae bacterium]|nr:HEPN domain-containing protein [Syntrophaceae bacterium]